MIEGAADERGTHPPSFHTAQCSWQPAVKLLWSVTSMHSSRLSHSLTWMHKSEVVSIHPDFVVLHSMETRWVIGAEVVIGWTVKQCERDKQWHLLRPWWYQNPCHRARSGGSGDQTAHWTVTIETRYRYTDIDRHSQWKNTIHVTP